MSMVDNNYMWRKTDIPFLIEFLLPVVLKWSIIAISLGLDMRELKDCDGATRHDTLRKVLTKLMEGVIFTVERLANVLRSDAVAEPQLADKLISEFMKMKGKKEQEKIMIEDTKKKIAAFIKTNKVLERKTAHIMIIGYPGNGKSHLLDNLLEQSRLNYSSTGILDSVVVVDVADKNTSSQNAVIGNGSSWIKIDSVEDSMQMQLHQCDKLAIPYEKQLPQLEQVPLDATPQHSHAIQSEPTNSLQENIFRVLKQNKMSYADLESSFSLYIRDTGGQVEFQEVLSILINGPSIFFFVIKANLTLDQPLTLEYRKGKKVINRYESTTTTRQALVQTLTTIQNTAKPTGIATHDSVVFIIGTHIDKIKPRESKEEKISKLNDELHNLIESHMFELIVYKDKKSNAVLFPVSNTHPEVKDFQLIRDRVNKKIVGTNAFKVPYPLGYLLFSLELRHCKDDVVSRTKCKEIAAKFHITDDNEVTDMLKFLHHRMGIIQYYETDDLKHLVIKEPQVLFNRLTELMVKTFPSSEALLPSTEKDLIKGIIKDSELKQLFTEFSAMKPKEFISFLEHLRIAASFHEESEKYFFIPSVINHLSEKSLGKEAKSKVSPLAITFKSSYCPKGVFGMTVCHFMSKEKKEDQITFSLEKQSIYKDLVCLKVYTSDEPQGKVFVKIQSSHSSFPFTSSHMEVCFYPNEDKDFITLAPLCNRIRTTLMDGIQRSLTQLNYSESRVGAAESFKCPSCQQLHKKVTNNGKVSVDCNNSIYSLNECCSCWFIEAATASSSTIRQSPRIAAKRKRSVDSDGYGEISSSHKHWYPSIRGQSDLRIKITKDTEDRINEEWWSDLRILNTEDINDSMYYTKFGPLNIKLIHKKGIKGNGISLAIIDSYDADTSVNGGFQKEHATFRNSELKIIDMTDEISKANCKTSSHALTSVAIAVGNGFEGCYWFKSSGDNKNLDYPGGIAPLAKCTVLLVNHKDEDSKSLNEALKYVIDKKFDVVSMSFGKPEKDYLKTHIKDLSKTNTVIVAAAGNSGGWLGVMNPAAYKDVISVGSWNTMLKISSFSPPPEDVDVHFYGELMVPHRDATKKFLKFCTGTSIAAPGIAGAICLILQCAKKHKLDLSRVKQKVTLLNILKDMTIDDHGNFTHFGYNSIVKAYENPKYFDSYLKY